MTISSLLITAAVSAGIPWLTAFVAARHAPGGVKAGLNVVFVSVTGILTAVQNDPAYDWQHGVLYAVEGFVVATAAHYGLLKPAGVTGSTGAIQGAVPAGIGGRSR